MVRSGWRERPTLRASRTAAMARRGKSCAGSSSPSTAMVSTSWMALRISDNTRPGPRPRREAAPPGMRVFALGRGRAGRDIVPNPATGGLTDGQGGDARVAPTGPCRVNVSRSPFFGRRHPPLGRALPPGRLDAFDPSPHDRDRRATHPMLAVPPVPVLEHEVRDDPIGDRLIDPVQELHGRPLAAFRPRIELPDVGKVRGHGIRCLFGKSRA